MRNPKIIFKKNRKGIIDNTMLAILAVVIILVFGLFVFKAYTNFRDKMSVQSCKNSIEAHTAVATLSAKEMFTDIKCPTSEITIKDNKKAKEILAEDMHRCWYIWGQGQGEYFKGAGSFCQVCGIYQFGDKGQEIDGFMKYLETQPIQVKYSGDIQGISYQDYLQGYSTPNSAAKVGNKMQDFSDGDFLNTSQKYATIFVYASGKDYIDKVLEGGGRTALGATGLGAVILGTAGGIYGVNALGATIMTALTTVETVNFWNPVGWIAGGVTLVSAGVYAVYKATHPGEPEWISFVAFRPYDNETLNSLGCEKLYVNQMSNVGKG